MRLLARDELLTLGAADRDIDWEALWRAELAKDDRPSDRPKGAPDLSAVRVTCHLCTPSTVHEVSTVIGVTGAGPLGAPRSVRHLACGSSATALIHWITDMAQEVP